MGALRPSTLEPEFFWCCVCVTAMLGVGQLGLARITHQLHINIKAQAKAHINRLHKPNLQHKERSYIANHHHHHVG